MEDGNDDLEKTEIYIYMQRNGINRVTKVRKIQGTRTGNQETNRNRKGGRTKKRKA
jgi:hypothetical protein